MNTGTSEFAGDDARLQGLLEQYAATKDPVLRDEIAIDASWLATRGARRFWDRGEPFDDLVQVAQIGLLKAIDRFDAARGIPFGAFATPTIIGELRRHFRDHTWSVHVPRRAKDLRTAVNSTHDDLARELERSPLVAEIAERLQVSAEAVIEALEANSAYRTSTLDQAGDQAGDHRATADRTDFDAVLDREVIAKLLDRLPPREQRILRLRFFDELSQAQIAEQIGTSQVHVGRLIASSLAALRRLTE